MKKTLSLFLSLVMLLSITAGLSFNAYAGTITNVSVTVPNDLIPVADAKVNNYDLSTITFTRNGEGLINTASFSAKYQEKGTSSWTNIDGTTKFIPGKIYRLKIHIDAGGNNDQWGTGVACTLNGTTITESDKDSLDSTDNFFFVNRSETSRYLDVCYYIGMITTTVNGATLTKVPDIDLGKDVEIPFAQIDSNLNIKKFEIEEKDGDTWKTATKYKCNTKYRYKITIYGDEGYLLAKPFYTTIKTTNGLTRNSTQADISSDKKSGVLYCEFPNAPVAHTYGTEGDARFTCSVCGTVDAEKKAEYAAAEALADAKDSIAALPEADKVTLADKEKIEAARKAFDALTDEQKKSVDALTYQKLVAAEAALAALEKEQQPTDGETPPATVEENPFTLTFGKIKKIKKSAKKTVIKVTLKKNGKALKKKKVTLKIAGKKYTVKTNKKGVAKFTIKKAALKKLKVGKKAKLVANYGKKIKVTKKVKVVK